MRYLIACPQCQRQYDASDKPIGSRFRCHCGQVLTVESGRGHDAQVVRCSSCGAPREDGSQHCRFCGADFTLHERDLHTVCPACLARVSDRAKFCHYCGTRLTPEHLAGEKTQLPCPVCGGQHCLVHRQLGQVAAMECDCCAGLWLGREAFDQLTRQASIDAQQTDPFLKSLAATSETTKPRKQRGPIYRHCPVCGQMMNRRNYGKRSGVIIDLCRNHGMWFDADELPRILAWIRDGGLIRSQKSDVEDAVIEERLRRFAPNAPRKAVLSEPGDDFARYGSPEYGLGKVLAEVLWWMMR